MQKKFPRLGSTETQLFAWIQLQNQNVVRAGEFETVDEVVFALPGDLAILGARTIEGFGVRVDSRRRRLVAGGPIPAASCGLQPRAISTRWTE